jgi:CheY-like chemotaxis protein/HPt (histidine-containing phosphotransfer) domain-containing protein
LRIIKSSSDHLARIINDILDFSKLQNGKLNLEKMHFPIHQILEDISIMFEKQSLKNNTSLSFSISPDTPQTLLGDPYRLKQILINLVSNSVKFTKNGKVHFSVNALKNKSPDIELIIEVTDNGIGIDENKIDYIFEDFTQEEMSTTRKYGGTGLGLSIVKKLVELHNGTIECISKKNNGTKITCKLPYHIGDEKKIRKEAEPTLFIPEEIKSLRFLIVDDEEYNRLLFKTILTRWKVKFSEAINGMEALEILKTERFDLLFMDARMPGIDGLRATQFIRDEMKIKESDMPVICISAGPVNEDWQKFQKAGMNAFLPKPFTEEMLLTTILSVIKDYATETKAIPTLAEKENEPVNAEKINLNNLYHISGGDEQFVKQMLISFIESTDKGLIEMEATVRSGQTSQAYELVHKMLPPCRHLGATQLCSLLKQIEDNIRNNEQTITLESLMADSIQEFAGIKGIIESQIAKIG